MSVYAARDEEFGPRSSRGTGSGSSTHCGIGLGFPTIRSSTSSLRSWVSFAEAAVVHWIGDRPMARDELIETLVMMETDLRDHWRSRRAAWV